MTRVPDKVRMEIEEAAIAAMIDALPPKFRHLSPVAIRAAMQAEHAAAERHGWRLMPVKATKEMLHPHNQLYWNIAAERVEPWS